MDGLVEKLPTWSFFVRKCNSILRIIMDRKKNVSKKIRSIYERQEQKWTGGPTFPKTIRR